MLFLWDLEFSQLSVEKHFYTWGCEERSWAREDGDFPLLEAVVRERLVKTQQAGKGLADPVVICKYYRVNPDRHNMTELSVDRPSVY
jgi:hypothetical protein